MSMAFAHCADVLSCWCRCIGCANQAPDAAEPDQPKKAARVAPAQQMSLPPQQAAAASSRERFPVPEAIGLRLGTSARQAPEALPVRPSHDGQAERPLPPGAHIMAQRDKTWDARQYGAAPPHLRPPHSAPAQRFPLPETYALRQSDMVREQGAPAQRFPQLDTHVLKPPAQPKEGASRAGAPSERPCAAVEPSRKTLLQSAPSQPSG